MFNFFKKDPSKTLKAKHKKLLEEAMHIQRSGDLKLYAAKIEEAERLAVEIDRLNAS